MNVFIYRQTSTIDPCRHGVWGICDCLGDKRRGKSEYAYGAVLGIGGKGIRQPLAAKITWIGIGVHKQETPGKKGPLVTFDHVCLMYDNGPELCDVAPLLYAHMFRRNKIPRSGYSQSKTVPKEIREEIHNVLMQYSDCPPSEECDCDPDLICNPC